MEVVQCYPDLQEIGIRNENSFFRRPAVSPCVENFQGLTRITFDQAEVEAEAVEHLRSLKRLTVVEVEFAIAVDELSTADYELHRAQTKARLEVWKSHLIQVLKESPPNERKFLRWKVTGREFHLRSDWVVLENGELEVLPET